MTACLADCAIRPSAPAQHRGRRYARADAGKITRATPTHPRPPFSVRTNEEDHHVQATVTLGALAAATAALAADPSNPSAPPAQPGAAPAAELSGAPAAGPAEANALRPHGTIARTAFTTAIQDREPVDNLTALGTDRNKIYFFTELRDMTGQTVTHRWEYNGKVMAEVPFQIGGPRWRVYSSKTLDPALTGEWKVSVVDSQGNALGVSTFRYTPAESAARPAADTAPAAATQPAAPSAPAGSASGN